ncbi:MAG TPA: universal stress protein [Desulfobacteraceae bacterium]|nr:universal stress protein [Desulfobacteraceae bacterium]
MSKKVLVAFDDSENASRGVVFIDNYFSRDVDVTLLSVVPDTAAVCSMNSPSLTPYFRDKQSAFCTIEDMKKQVLKEALASARARLEAAGFDPERITTKVVSEKKGVAGAIIEEAGFGYDTLVIGRKGHSALQEFFMGSITYKVINSVRKMNLVLVR